MDPIEYQKIYVVYFKDVYNFLLNLKAQIKLQYLKEVIMVMGVF